MSVFTSIFKKKLSDEKLANIFINGIVTSTTNGFHVVADFINEDTAFVSSPLIDGENHHEFTLILLIGNLSFLESSFDPQQANNVEQHIYEKLAQMYGMSQTDFRNLAKDYLNLIYRLNNPSKNMIYGMSKAVFDKYQLYNYQDEYFKRMQVPNPLFLKRMDEILENFIWDWDNFFRKYKLD